MLDGTISVQQQKTGTALFIPVHPELRAVLDALPKTDLQFLTTLRGRAFSAEVFGKWFKIACRRAGLSHCSAHGLRTAAATRLADAGCSASMIAAVTGHKTLVEVSHYTRAADQRKLAQQALAIQLGAEGERECPTQLSNLRGNAQK